MSENKKTIYSVALVIYNEDRSKYLLVKRPDDDDSLPGHWGFPATSKKDVNEDWKDTAVRAAKIKLGVDIEIVKNMGEDTIDRGDYVLVLRDYEVKVASGEISVPQDTEGVTQYVDMRWTDDHSDLQIAARKGSLCARVFLRSNDISWD